MAPTESVPEDTNTTVVRRYSPVCHQSINPQPLTSSLCVLVTSRLRPQTRSTRAVSVSGAGPPVVIPDTDAGLESLSAASVIHIVFGKPSERVSRSMRNILTFSKSEGVLVLVLVCVLFCCVLIVVIVAVTACCENRSFYGGEYQTVPGDL